MMRGRLGLFVLVAFGVGMVVAGSAEATATTSPAEWYHGSTSTSVTTLTGSTAVTASIASHPGQGSKIDFHTTIGGTSVTLTATGASCVSCSIENAAVTVQPDKVAVMKGQLTLTGVTADTPEKCSVRSSSGVAGHITTDPFIVHLDYMEGEKGESWLGQIRPASGETFFSFKLEGCPIAGTYNVKGTQFAKAANGTGVVATSQSFSFGSEINKAAGGALKVGAEAADLTGSINISSGGKFLTVK